MSEVVREPSDSEFSALMDERAPNRNPVENAAPPAAPAAVEPPAVDELPEKYRGKTPAEIVQMHQELEARLGQQGQELGELRALRGEFDELKQHLTAPEPETPPWATSAPAFDSLDEQVLTNPKETLDWITQHQPQLYNRAIQTWAQLDPFGAADYNTEKKLADVRSQYESELAAVRAPVIASQNDAILQQAYANVANTNPMLAQVAEDIPGLLEDNPEFKVLLSNGDVATRERALNNLVSIASVRKGPVESAPAPNAAQAAKVAATVASGSAGAIRPSGGENPTDNWKASFLASEGTSIRDELARNRAPFGRA